MKLFSLIAAAALLTACSQNDDSKNIKIILDWVPNTNHTGLFAAEKFGWFKDAGLNVQIIQPPEGSTTQLIGAGGAAIGVSFQDTMAKYLAAKNPLPITAIGAIIAHNTSGLISPKDKQITSFKALANHTYATWDDPIEQAILKHLMQKEGASYSSLKIVPYGWDVRAALKSQADAAWIYYGWDGIAMEYFKEPTNFLSAKDADKRLDYYTPVIIANNAWLAKNAQTAKKLMAAISKGYTWAAKHPEQAGELMCEKIPEMSCDLIKASQNYLSPRYIGDSAYWGEFDPSRWAAFYEFLKDTKVIDKDISKMGFSNEYLPKQ